MPIGEDIKDVLDELGTSATIYRWPGPTTIPVKIDHEFFTTHSSEFLRQFFSSATLVHDSPLLSGDVISSMGYWFICASISPSYFENDIVDYTAVFYRCNCVGKISRYSQREYWDSNYKKVRKWEIVGTEIHALQYENNYDQKQSIAEDVAAITVQGNLLFLPNYITPEIGDRWYPDAKNSEVFFLIKSIDTKRIDNVSICILSNDERE